MEAERWLEVERLYHSALEMEKSQRAAFLETACSADEPLKQEVGSLLEQAERADGFLEVSATEVAAKALAASATAGAHSYPAAIGRYRVVRLLGEGGMGAVYEAEQQRPRRIVALKVIKPGLATAEKLRRFQHESEALGRLQHPGIAQIYEASTADTGLGLQPYFAMELVRGDLLPEYADAHQLDTRQRLALVAKICEAVDHAHQRGVIHRDLKPGNILVDETGQPKILDFGVARVTDSDALATRHTDWGQLVGTLAYMSPEQVLGDPLALDIRSDVYALGVTLYELLAGKLPYSTSGKALHEAVRAIREEDPPALGSIRRSYRGDIATIVAKALEKDKARRYASAAELGGDIRRYLADEPIMARPATASYQLHRFARRHKAVVSGTAAVFLVLATGVVASTWEAVRARRAEGAAVEQRDRATAAERLVAAQRDRALAAEETSRRERDRAVTAEGRAQQERNATVSEKRRADAEAAAARAVNDFLQNDLFAQASAAIQAGPHAKPDPDLKVRTALDRAAGRITGKFDGQPEVEAAIRDTIGQTYFDLGLYSQAGTQLERALELHRRELGTENPKTLKTMGYLGITGSHQAKYTEAQALLSRALQISRRVLGAEHPDTLWCMNNLAVHYYQQGKYAQAETLFSETLQTRRRLLGAEHPDTLFSMYGLAYVYYFQGKFAQAEALFSQTLEIRRRVLGPEHPETLRTMGSLGNIYNDRGKYAEAETLLTQALEINRRVWGPEHPEILACLNNLAIVYHSLGKLAQAEKLTSQALEISRRVLGPENIETIRSMGNLAVYYSEQGKYEQAETLFSQTQEIERRVLGPQHLFTLVTLSDIASMYQRQGKYALAETHALQSLAGLRHTLGTEHPQTMDVADDLALAYQSQGKFGESEPLAREVAECDRKKRPDDWQRFRAESVLGESLAGQKKYAEAEPLLLQGHQGMAARKDRMTLQDLYHLDRAREWIVQLYEAWDKPEKAAEWGKN